MSPRNPINPKNKKGYRGEKIPTFCDRVRLRRIQLGLTQEQLGRIIGVPKTRISEIELGRVPSNPERIVAIVEALQCDIGWLMGQPNSPNPTEHIVKEINDWVDALLEEANKRFGGKNEIGEDGKRIMRFFRTNLRFLIKEWKSYGRPLSKAPDATPTPADDDGDDE